MNTFLPEPNFHLSAISLDPRRLAKQRVETLQILRAIHDPNYGWQHHPAVTMWRGAPGALVDYGIAICEEWRRRGGKDSCLPQLEHWKRRVPDEALPWWFGLDAFHEAHRSKLLEKDPVWYRGMWPGTPEGLEYVWPGRGVPGIEEDK